MAKTVLITGGTTGIGRCVALRFAKAGYNIAANHVFDAPEGFVEEIQALGVACKTIQGDISKFDEAESVVKETKAHFGSLDVLVNNAGITKDGLLMRMSEEDFDAVISVNLKGAFNMIRHTSNIMLKQRSGAIISLSSVVGLMGNVGQANYAASKAGLLGLTKTTARELASRGITCNAVAPGFIDTAMTKALPEDIKGKMLENIPLKRFGLPEEVADAIFFLAESPYITGQVLNIDGGMVMQ